MHTTQQGSDKHGAMSAVKFSPLHQKKNSCRLVPLWPKGSSATGITEKESKPEKCSYSYGKIPSCYLNFYLILSFIHCILAQQEARKIRNLPLVICSR